MGEAVRVEQTFRLTGRPFVGGLVLDLSGDITRAAEGQILQYRNWELGLEDGGSYLVLNFTDVSYINSAGIACLIRLTRTGMKAGYHTFAYGLTPHYKKLFRMVGLTEHMMIYPDEYAVMRRIEELRGGQA
jgi:stage II sporulation protein AA (anti-sigma F factor antagonist)